MPQRPDHHHTLVETVADVLGHLVPEAARCRSFEDDARHYGPLNRRPLGVRSIPLNRIVGSVGRARELGQDFRPRRHLGHRGSERFERIRAAVKAGIILPPVELYKLGYHYYVLDGNHRVAVAKELTHNDGEIDAVVTLFLPVGDTEAARVFIERHAFEEATGLTMIGAVERGHYPELQAEIEAYRATLPERHGEPPTLREAAAGWSVTIWQPRATAIRRAGLGRRWPDKRTADIYCYIREHQRSAAAAGQPADWATALASFKALHSVGRRGQLSRLMQLLHLAPADDDGQAGPRLSPPANQRDLEAETPPPAP